MKRGLRKLYKLYIVVRWIIVFRVRYPFRFIHSYFFLDRSILFDRVFYLEKNGDVRDRKIDPLAHYLTIGHRSSNPNRLFDTAYYLRQNPDGIKTGINPLIHYIDHGAQSGLKPNPLFDTAYYLSENPDVIETGVNPLAHYLEHGACDDRKPNPLFDPSYYRQAYGDVLEMGMNPLVHYIEFGAREDRKPNPLFDTAYYLRRNPNVVEAEINPLAHYLDGGAYDGRKPNPLFDSAYYLETNPTVAKSGMNPLVHYLIFGVIEGQKPNPLFDTKYYLEKYPDVAASSTNPLVHYLEKGAAEGRDPGPDFNTAYYLEMSPDVVQTGINPLVHYLEHGIREGRYPNNAYKLWVRENRLTDEKRRRILEHINSFIYRPTFSLIVPVFNTDERWLRRCLDSVTSQLYPNWELCIADDASTDPTVKKVLEEYRDKDPRIRVVLREENGHISAASNSALDLATGEFVALLDHDDEIAEDALYENAALLNEHSDADMIYSDEDKMTEEGERHSPFFKPDWSPDTFLSHMYTCHLGVYRATFVRGIGGFRVGFEGSQDYDLVLRFTERTQKIYHIPKILYHWRSIAGSTALATESKDYAHKAGKKALQEAMARRGEGGWVEEAQNYRSHYIVHYALRKEPLISILIPTRDNAECLNACLLSITAKTTYSNYEILVLDNGSIQENAKSVMDNWRRKEPSKIRVIPLEMPFNYSRLNNLGANDARGDFLLLLNDDVIVITSEWLQEMAGQASRSHIGAVGAHLLYPDNTIQHAGVILGMGGIASHSHCHANADSPGYYGWLLTVTNYAAVTGACLMVKKNLYQSLNGLDESLAIAYNDVDFCLRLLRKGYYNVTLPQVRLHHAESKSRGRDDCGEKLERFRRETEIMQERWGDMIKNDPFYNPNLTRKREDFSVSCELSPNAGCAPTL